MRGTSGSNSMRVSSADAERWHTRMLVDSHPSLLHIKCFHRRPGICIPNFIDARPTSERVDAWVRAGTSRGWLGWALGSTGPGTLAGSAKRLGPAGLELHGWASAWAVFGCAPRRVHWEKVQAPHAGGRRSKRRWIWHVGTHGTRIRFLQACSLHGVWRVKNVLAEVLWVLGV